MNLEEGLKIIYAAYKPMPPWYDLSFIDKDRWAYLNLCSRDDVSDVIYRVIINVKKSIKIINAKTNVEASDEELLNLFKCKWSLEYFVSKRGKGTYIFEHNSTYINVFQEVIRLCLAYPLIQ